MEMKSRTASSSLVGLALFWPGWVFAAEGEPAEGSWFALIFYAINFLLFVWMVQKYGWPYITQFFHDRSRSIREIRSRAEKAYQEVQELANHAARLLGRLEIDKREMMSELDQETAYQITQIVDAAHAAVGRIRRETELTTVALHDGAQRRLREIMAAAAGTIARELLSRNLQASDQARLLQGFIDQVEDARS